MKNNEGCLKQRKSRVEIIKQFLRRKNISPANLT
jgi:hypothetical protein